MAKGIILLLRELEGDHAILDVGRLMEETGATAVYEVNVLEEALKELSSPLLIAHFETKFVKLEFVRE
jgi:alpha-mannosidase